jgi:hypothetical protein
MQYERLVLLPQERKIPNDNYNEWALEADTQVVLLYPDERMAFVKG